MKISLNQFNVEQQDLSVKTLDAKAMSDMLRDLNCKTLEDRRTIYRLTQLYKSVHNIVAINIDAQYTSYEKRHIEIRKMYSISFTHPTSRKNCHRYSHMPRTVAELNHLPVWTICLTIIS